MSTPTTEVTVTFTKHQARQVYRAIQALGWDVANLDITATSEAYMALALAIHEAAPGEFSDVEAHVYPVVNRLGRHAGCPSTIHATELLDHGSPYVYVVLDAWAHNGPEVQSMGYTPAEARAIAAELLTVAARAEEDAEGYVVCDGGCGNAATISDEACGLTFHLCDDCIDAEEQA